MRSNARRSRLPARWVALAAALHLAAGVLLAAILSRGDRERLQRLPVDLVEPEVPAAIGPASIASETLPEKVRVGTLPPRRRTAIVRGAPVQVRAVPAAGEAESVRPYLSSVELLAAFRDGTVPDDSLSTSEAVLREAALRDAAERWNLAFAEMIPELEALRFVEALQNSPFPRR